MSKNDNMNDEEWNTWTADVRTFVADKKEVMRMTQEKDGKDFNAKKFNWNFGDIVSYLERGDVDNEMRGEYKKNILSRGRDMSKWPKRQGGGVSTPAHQLTVLGQAEAIYNMAHTAFWNVLEENDATHLEMTRSSKKDGGTDGQPYGNLENFTKSRTASRIASFKGDIRDGLWTNAEDPKLFNLAQPILRPYVLKASTVTEVVDTEGEEE